MVVYNAASKELTAKIVYYGPGFGGKTTNLQFLHRRLEPSSVGNLLTLAATADRTIFFDLLPVELGDLKGYRIRFQVATVPGQSPYNETRRVVLRGADGVVFVVDSRWSQLPKNLESLQNLRDNLKEEGIDATTIPFAVQFNKRDLPDVLAVDALQEGLGLGAHPFIEAVASEGKGVVETFKLISKLTFVDILRRLQKKGAARPARPTASETENLSAWKTSILHGKSTLHPEIVAPAAGPSPRASAPEPLASSESEDMTSTRAIPTLRPHAAPEPFPFADEEAVEAMPAAASPPLDGERANAVVFESPAPFPEVGITEDTTPEFFQKERARPTAAPSPPPPDEPPDTEITAPMTFRNLITARRPGTEAESAAVAEPPPPIASPTTPVAGAAERATSTVSPLEERMIQLAVASTWGDRLSAAEEKMAALPSSIEEARSVSEDLERRLSGLESRLGEQMAALEQGLSVIPAIEARIGRAETGRAWEKDINRLRTDWANARLTGEEQLSELRKRIGQIQQDLADASGREMELVAQTNRDGLGRAAEIEKLGSRIQEMEEKLNPLAIDQESRLARLERQIEEQSGRAASDHDALRRTILEIEENLRKSSEESEERHRTAATDLENAIRGAREENDRQRASGEDVRRFLSDALTDLVAKLRGPGPGTE